MFKKANIKLTFIYSFMFLISVWVFSSGLYIWMDHFFGANYVSEIQRQEGIEGELDPRDTVIATIARDIALDRLRNTLLILNGALIVIVPAVAWTMTQRTLAPLKRIHEQQKQFVSDVAHELRTPLSIMAGEMEVALSKDRTVSDYKQVLASSKEETDRLINLAENLLFLAREDQGKQVVEFERVDITDLVGSIIASLQTESSNKKISLHFNPEAEPTFVWGNPSMLRRLFFNLIHNAILYTPDCGSIWISLSANKQNLQAEIKDNGIGISKEDQEKIFNRFYRVDSSRSQTRGYGLGLAICKSIVDLHHGTIALSSALGQGSTFVVTLPRAKD